jgi:L-ascorbate metabolism protein UlaG (beta-lactamase superfamily)
MKIQQIRSATLVLTIGEHRLVVDPMLSDPGAMPGFKMVGGGRRRNPLVALPEGTEEALATATGVLITHEHPDHLDGPGLRWIKERRLPVWTNGVDAPNLRRKGVEVRAIERDLPGVEVEVIRSRHGQGLLGWLLGPVSGYYLAHPDEPGVYLTGDSVLTASVTEAIGRLQPAVIVAPAGAANMGLGGDILFSVDELVRIIRQAEGEVVLNHLEALDHCPTTRAGLRQRLEAEGLGARVHIPADGEAIEFTRPATPARARPRPAAGERPGMQKWLTAPFAGT